MLYSVIAAKDGDTYHDEVEAGSQEEAESEARTQLAEAWRMTEELERARAEGDETLFDAELDGFSVDPDPNEKLRTFVRQIARMTLTTETECGQCEGSGTTDAMGHSEECPVCDGSGMIEGEEEGASETLDALVEQARKLAA